MRRSGFAAKKTAHRATLHRSAPRVVIGDRNGIVQPLCLGLERFRRSKATTELGCIANSTLDEVSQWAMLGYIAHMRTARRSLLTPERGISGCVAEPTGMEGLPRHTPFMSISLQIPYV